MTTVSQNPGFFGTPHTNFGGTATGLGYAGGLMVIEREGRRERGKERGGDSRKRVEEIAINTIIKQYAAHLRSSGVQV
jgi:hypothetical protein